MSWIEVKIYLHYQQISKSTARTLKKMQAVTSAQELSVQIVAYYNIYTSAEEETWPITAIKQWQQQTMTTMLIPVTATIATAMIFRIRLKVKKSFTGIWWQEILSKGL